MRSLPLGTDGGQGVAVRPFHNQLWQLPLFALFALPVQAAETLEYLSSIEQAPIASDTFGRLTGAQEYLRLQSPVAVGARDNTVYLFDDALRMFYRFDTQLNTIVPLPNASSAIDNTVASITVAPDYSFYATDPYGRQVIHVSYDDRLLSTFVNHSNMAHPVATALDIIHDRLLVADSTFDHIIAFDTRGFPLFAFGERGIQPQHLRLIVDMATMGQHLYLIDQLNHEVKCFNFDGDFLFSFLRSEVDNPTAIGVDQDYRVYISDGFDDHIKIYYEGKLVETIGATGAAPGSFQRVTDLSIDRDRLYVADSLNGRIQVFQVNPLPQAMPNLDGHALH